MISSILENRTIVETWLHIVVNLSVWLLAILSLGLLLLGMRFVASRRWLIKRKLVYLELTPPTRTDQDPLATGKLFAVLHGLGTVRSLKDKLLGRKLVCSLEIASSRAHGIRYIVGVAEQEVDSVQHIITAYVPEMKIRTIPDYLSAEISRQNTKVLEFKQTGHFAYPLERHDIIETYDPIAHLTGAMTQLKDKETMVLQFVISPVSLRHGAAITRRLLNNEDLLSHLGSKNLSVFGKALHSLNRLMFSVIELVGSVIHGSSTMNYQTAQKDAHDKLQIAQRLKPARQLSSFEQELAASIDYKVRQPLFRVSLRVIVVSPSKQERSNRLSAIRASLASFTVPKYQSLGVRRSWLGLVERHRLLNASRRLPTLLASHNCLLSVTEIAGLYHFPNSAAAKTENIVKSLSRTLPTPVSFKANPDFDITLGENNYHSAVTPIGLTAAERQRHVYIIGGTGNGKTTMLLYAITQDIAAGKGVIVLDPHGDLAETVLRHVPEGRLKDVIYFNPDDISYPIGLNLLELPEGLSGDELLREKDLVTESAISVMRKIFSDDDSGGHRIEYILRNTIQTALTLDKPTLFTIFDLLNDNRYRRKVVKGLEDKDLKNFWKNELGKAGDFQKVKMAAGITAKIGRFLFSASAKRVLEQERSTIDFDDILSSGKILVCNFSKGLIGEDTSTLFGTTVLAKLQMASLRRARLPQAERRPAYLYVDEFQNFATMAFVQMLSEARKYKLFLTMAEQSTAQQDEQRLVDIILANVGSVICFRSGSPADERHVLPLFSPYIESGEIASLPSFNFYMRIAALEAQEPLSGMTVLLSSDGSAKSAARIKQLSRKHYAIRYKAKKNDLPNDSRSKKSKNIDRSQQTLSAIGDTS